MAALGVFPFVVAVEILSQAVILASQPQEPFRINAAPL